MALADSHQIIAIKTSLPSGWKTKRDINNQIAGENKSDPKRSSFRVDVFASYLGPTRNDMTSARNWLREQGLPWGFTGQVLVPNHEIPRIITELEQRKRANETLYKEFIQKLPSRIEDDKKEGELGGLHNNSDYTASGDLEGKWAFEIMRDTVPDPQHDVRAGWTHQEQVNWVNDAKKQEEENFRDATTELLRRTAKPLKNMVDRLSVYEGGRQGRFSTKTFIGNVRDVVDTMIAGNLRDDPELESIRREIVHEICGLEVKELREDPELREETKNKAEKILNRISAFGADL